MKAIFVEICIGLVFGISCAPCLCQGPVYENASILNHENSELPSDTVNVIYFDSFCNVWIGTQAGLAGILNNTWFQYSENEIFKDNVIKGICGQDSDTLKKIYVATAEGLTMMMYSDTCDLDSFFTYTSRNSGLSSNYIVDVKIDEDQNKWIATDSGIHILHKDTWLRVEEFRNSNDERFFFKDFRITCMKWFDRLGQMLISLKGGGVARLSYNEVDGVSSATTYDTYWGDIISDTVYAIDIQGMNQWYGTDKGIQKHCSEEVMAGWADALTVDSGLIGNKVSCVLTDSRGNQWIGTDMGLSVIRPEKGIISLEKNNGLVDNNINAIVEDMNGQIWIGTQAGIQVFKLDEITGMDSEEKKNNSSLLQCYPNPARDYLNTKIYPPSNTGSFILGIYNMEGKSFFTQQYPISPICEVRINLKAAGLSKGLWILNICTGSKEESIKFIIE